MEKKPILNIMVDLETTAKTENAGILSWAMVAFAVNGEDVPDLAFEQVVKLRSCFFAGMFVDPDTQNWWIKQDSRAIHHIIHEEGHTIQSVANSAYVQLEALAENYDIYLWSRGIDFDLPKIKWCFEHLLEKDEKDFPFKFSHKMDVRTVLKFMQIDQSQFEFKGVPHISLDDCMHDIEMVQSAFQCKEKWMMAYTAVEAGKTAKELKMERTEVEIDCNGYRANLPELSEIIPEPYFNLEHDKDLCFRWSQIVAIETKLQNLKESCAMLKAENDMLTQQLKDLQAMG